MWHYYKLYWKNALDFKGRARRKVVVSIFSQYINHYSIGYTIRLYFQNTNVDK